MIHLVIAIIFIVAGAILKYLHIPGASFILMAGSVLIILLVFVVLIRSFYLISKMFNN